jgi:hypothetical protein
MTPDPVDLHSQSTVIAGWKGPYASVQGVSQTSGAIFMGEMRLDANKKEIENWHLQRDRRVAGATVAQAIMSLCVAGIAPTTPSTGFEARTV